MFDLQNAMLQSGGQELKNIIVADVDVSKLAKTLDITTDEAKIILDGIPTANVVGARVGVEIDKKELIAMSQKIEDQKIKEKNKKLKNKKKARIFTEENLEELGYVESGFFYLKEPNLQEYMNIRKEALDKDKININTYIAIFYILECAYDENKKKAFTPAFLQQFLAGKVNNAFITTSLKYWILFTSKKDYMGLELN